MAALRNSRSRVTQSIPRNTSAALENDWKQFEEWCEVVGRKALPASSDTCELYAIYCAEQLGHRVGTIRHRLWAVARTHKTAGYPSPMRDSVRAVMSGLAREYGSGQRQKSAITLEELRRMVGTLERLTFSGARDRAILLVGFSIGVRASDLVALRLQDVRITQGVAEVRVRREKNDQLGRGRMIGIVRSPGPLDAVGALENWIRLRGSDEGPLFINRMRNKLCVKWPWFVVKTAAASAGLDAREFGSHSLRAGMVTQLDLIGHGIPTIMARSGHKTPQMVVKYIRRREALSIDPLHSVALESVSLR